MPGMRTGRHLIRASLLLLGSCVLLGTQVQGPDPARDIAVSPAGADDNPGTAARPLRTLQRALDIAQPGSVIALARGHVRSGRNTTRGRGRCAHRHPRR